MLHQPVPTVTYFTSHLIFTTSRALSQADVCPLPSIYNMYTQSVLEILSSLYKNKLSICNFIYQLASLLVNNPAHQGLFAGFDTLLNDLVKLLD